MDASGLAAAGHQHSLILCRVEQPRLVGHVRFAALWLNRVGMNFPTNGRVDIAITEMQRQPVCRSRLGGMGKCPAVPAGNPSKAARQRLVRMGELGEPPKRSEPLGQAPDPLIDELATQAPRNQVEIAASSRCPRSEGSWKPFANFVQSLC